MKNSILFLFLIFFVKIYSQETPKVKLNDSTQLKLSALKVDVKIVGNFATTVYDMKFYNELDRTLEGELMFPLGEGQSVSGFSMDVNGKMREAVIVEKELARVAYESTVRQNIDPGLLEKTQGNNYKARIYPILPKNYKRIVITYEQVLFDNNDLKMYQLPLGFTENLDEFSVNIEKYGGAKPLDTSNNLVFAQTNNKYHATLYKQDYTPSSSITIQIPNSENSFQILSFRDFFYINHRLEPDSRIKEKPKKVTVLWDSSFSTNKRKIEKEIGVLDLYFKYLQNCEVQLISFNSSVDVNKTFKVSNGDWLILKNEIENIVYDGGTSLSFLDKLKIKSDEVLLFTDGLANLGGFTRKIKRSIYVINSSVSGDHRFMKQIATSSGGNYINLSRYSIKNALEILKYETYQFLGVANNKAIEEVYPNHNTNVMSDFSLAGKFSEDTSIKLLFGYQNKITKEIEIPISNKTEDKITRRLWAKQKLQSLSKNTKENKRDIIYLAKQYKLITDYTSMLILDRIEDYVKYRIEPPNELKEAYKERIANIEEEELYKKEELEERKIYLFKGYEKLLTWYNTKFPEKIEKPRNQTNSVNESNSATVQHASIDTSQEPTNNTTNTPVESRKNTIDPTKRTVSGVITDNEGLPLPGVNIIVKGTASGVQTDFDGNFMINVETDQELVISYVGFTTKEITADNSGAIQVKLTEDASMLEEVVVMAQGITTQKMTRSTTISTITSESLEGKVTGISVQNSQPETNSSIQIRGVSSISGAQPLYILDGIPVNDNPTGTLSPDEIESIQILKGESGNALYGAKGSNGVVVITTKTGKIENKEKIDALNQKISDKIELKSWNPDTPYLKTLEQEKTIELAYSKYLEIRNQYANTPAFYLDVADFFDKRKASDIAIKILTNLMEVELDNHELMRALAYKLEYFEQYNLAVIVYEKILELRPEEPQSYRDLALAYEYDEAYQKSFDLLYKIYDGELLEKDEDERFLGIEELAYVELNRLVYKYERKLKLSKSIRKQFKETPVDVRVVIDWNHNDTDIDLWVIDPNKEKGYYSNSETEIGGRLSSDMTEGYGPEEFMLKNALKGKYKVMIDYFADNVQKISGPTVLKVTLFTNYGKKNESRKISIVRLGKEEKEMEIGNLIF
ncbi:VIT domain-containing protein [Aquimarina sp. 2201CG14-23]|uniref:VIT domain-containing protein n=1 Tax=Aquimarina mycalae TaxID=3040073 RepID=UPI00247822F4|nr:VIT domain-containing protein [Aquimarina sp. 2201CG14-23]MDH7445079.1 VIT domain-containing protein [Aquimarina sp. 2201CG14-23]